MNLTAAELHHLQAAEGWLELGMHVEAFNELDEIEPLHQTHPEVLLLRGRIYLAGNKPDQAHVILSTVCELLPRVPDAWFYLACACSRRGEPISAEASLKKCFITAAKLNEEQKWQDHALLTKHLDGLWCSNQISI